MSDEKEIDYGEAIFQLRQAARDVRKAAGESAEPVIKPEAPFCSFCGKGKNEIASLLASPSREIFICNECVRYAQEIIDGRV